MNVTTLRGENSADACRRLGWTAGTRIVGDQGYGPSIWRITAVGSESILKVRERDDGTDGFEGMASLGYRDWKVVA